MNLTAAFARTQAKEKDILEGQVLQGGLFKGFKGSLCELVKYQRKVLEGMPLRPYVYGIYPVDEIFAMIFSSLQTLMREFPSLSANADL